MTRQQWIGVAVAAAIVVVLYVVGKGGGGEPSGADAEPGTPAAIAYELETALDSGDQLQVEAAFVIAPEQEFSPTLANDLARLNLELDPDTFEDQGGGYATMRATTSGDDGTAEWVLYLQRDGEDWRILATAPWWDA